MNDDTFVKKTLDSLKKMDVSFVKNFVVFNEISSTNTKAKELIKENVKDGTIVISRIQKSGRGRFKRFWESPDGGLYLSIILRPDISPDKATLLPLLAALAVSKTIGIYGISSAIKWPNDVRVNKRKIAGILLESDVYKNKLRFVILGIGINLNVDMNLFSDEIKDYTTSILSELNTPVDYCKFLENLILTLDKYYSMLKNGEFTCIISEWKDLSDTLNRRVKIITSSEEIIGKAYDIDNSGFLIVITESGEYKKIMSGDCLYFNEL